MLVASRLTLPGLLQSVNTLVVLGAFMLQGFMIRKLYMYILLVATCSFCINSVWMCILLIHACLVQIKVLPAEHNCPTTKLVENKMASQSWVADRLTDWLKKNPSKGPKVAKEKVEGDYGIKLKYSKAYLGMQLALQQIHGKYSESFKMLFNWKAQMEITCPSSIVEIDV